MGAHVTVALCEQAGPDEIAVLPEMADHRDGDVRDYSKMRQLVHEVAPDYIFHLAAVGVNNPFIAEETALQINLNGTVNLLRAIEQSRRSGDLTSRAVRRVVVTGTSYEYGTTGQLDPGNVYAASKVAAWAFCRMYYRAYGIPVVVVRPFNVYGPGQDERALIPSAIRAALSGQDFPMTPGEQQRDFVYVDDVIQGLLGIAVADGIDGESLDLGTGQAISVRNAVERIFALTKSVGRPLVGALPYRNGMVSKLVADADRTKRLTGWQAKIPLEKGLEITIKALAET